MKKERLAQLKKKNNANILNFVALMNPTNKSKGERTKTCWLGNRIICPSGATYLPADC